MCTNNPYLYYQVSRNLRDSSDEEHLSSTDKSVGRGSGKAASEGNINKGTGTSRKTRCIEKITAKATVIKSPKKAALSKLFEEEKIKKKSNVHSAVKSNSGTKPPVTSSITNFSTSVEGICSSKLISGHSMKAKIMSSRAKQGNSVTTQSARNVTPKLQLNSRVSRNKSPSNVCTSSSSTPRSSTSTPRSASFASAQSSRSKSTSRSSSTTTRSTPLNQRIAGKVSKTSSASSKSSESSLYLDSSRVDQKIRSVKKADSLAKSDEDCGMGKLGKASSVSTTPRTSGGARNSRSSRHLTYTIQPTGSTDPAVKSDICTTARLSEDRKGKSRQERNAARYLTHTLKNTTILETSNDENIGEADADVNTTYDLHEGAIDSADSPQMNLNTTYNYSNKSIVGSHLDDLQDAHKCSYVAYKPPVCEIDSGSLDAGNNATQDYFCVKNFSSTSHSPGIAFDLLEGTSNQTFGVEDIPDSNKLQPVTDNNDRQELMVGPALSSDASVTSMQQRNIESLRSMNLKLPIRKLSDYISSPFTKPLTSFRAVTLNPSLCDSSLYPGGTGNDVYGAISSHNPPYYTSTMANTSTMKMVHCHDNSLQDSLEGIDLDNTYLEQKRDNNSQRYFQSTPTKKPQRDVMPNEILNSTSNDNQCHYKAAYPFATDATENLEMSGFVDDNERNVKIIRGPHHSSVDSI